MTTDRLQGLDIARFLAFIGMVLVNFRIAAQVGGGGAWAEVPEAATDLPALITSALEGRAAALFVILAGVGATLGRAPWHLTLRRAGFLFVIGMADMLIFDADILHFYAFYFGIAALVMPLSDRALLWSTGAIVVAGALAQVLFNYDAGWDWITLEYQDFWTLPGFLRHTFYNGWHPVLPWAGFLTWGLWLGRRNLAARATQVGMALGGIAVALLAQGASAVLSRTPEIGEVMTTSPIPPGLFYMLAAGATATASLGAVLLITPRLGRLGAALAAPGRQTLTLYAAHILLGMGVMDELGLLDGSLGSPQILAISLAFCAGAALYAILWRRVARRGPLESLMRLVTEGKT